MKGKRSRSSGIRHPVRNAVLYGALTAVGIALVVLGVLDMRATGKSGSPLLMLGLLPALLGPIPFIHSLSMVRVFRNLRSGHGAIARWAVPATEFRRFCEEEQHIPARSVMVNFHKPPRDIPEAGVEVVFSDAGVLIGGGYFPLSRTGGRRLQDVRVVASDPLSIEFTMALNTMVRTSSATVQSNRSLHLLRVPVADDARRQAGDVVRRYQAFLDKQ